MEFTSIQKCEMRERMRKYSYERYKGNVSDKEITTKVIKAYNPEGANGVWIDTGEKTCKICCVDYYGDKYIITVLGVASEFDAKTAIINYFCGGVCFFDKYGNAFKF